MHWSGYVAIGWAAGALASWPLWSIILEIDWYVRKRKRAKRPVPEPSEADVIKAYHERIEALTNGQPLQ